MNNKRTVITIATGKKLFVDLAANLARSFLLWHPDTDIKFGVITDQPWLLPADIKDQIFIRTINPGEFGEGFSCKLHLDKFAADGQTLFIDSDCLIFDRIDFLFERFKGHQVSVAGDYISTGEWFGDIAAVCRKFDIARLPKFNGGLYYIEKSDTADKVYQLARKLEKQYDNIGFVRLRGRPNDEVLMALAMELCGQTPIIDDGSIMSDPQACQGGYKIDVLRGNRWLLNPPSPHPLHQSWYPFERVSPAIVHFLGYYTQHYPYKREVYRLKKMFAESNPLLTTIKARFLIQYPLQLKTIVKNSFRSLYHKLFGVRQIKPSERIV